MRGARNDGRRRVPCGRCAGERLGGGDGVHTGGHSEAAGPDRPDGVLPTERGCLGAVVRVPQLARQQPVELSLALLVQEDLAKGAQRSAGVGAGAPEQYRAVLRACVDEGQEGHPRGPLACSSVRTHTRSERSWLAETTNAPSGAAARPQTSPLCPSSVRMCSKRSASQYLMARSLPAEKK